MQQSIRFTVVRRGRAAGARASGPTTTSREAASSRADGRGHRAERRRYRRLVAHDAFSGPRASLTPESSRPARKLAVDADRWSLTRRQPQLQAQVHILLAKARQGPGTARGRRPTRPEPQRISSNDEDDVEINVKARQALIAALADSGRLDEAWAESLIMADVISDEVDDQLVGKAYWVIGNVAFLCNKVDEGLHYHELAAATFSPARNLNVWAKFNKASAAMRLAADVADADTLRCIERAELATDVIGGSRERLHLLLKLNRGSLELPGRRSEIRSRHSRGHLRRSRKDVTASTWARPVCFWAGRTPHWATRPKRGRASLEAADHFESAGAPHRAEQARDFLKAELGRDSLLVRGCFASLGSGRN